MSIKTDAQLALDEKIDLARTLVRYKNRRRAVRELNEVEDLIKKRHDNEVASGNVTQIDLESIGVGDMAKEVPDDDKVHQLASGEADTDSA